MNLLSVLVLSVVLCGCASTDGKRDTRSTSELHLRRNQIVQALGEESKIEIDFLKPIWMRGPTRADRIEEKEEIERELLRRWKNGDKEAYLPLFEPKA